QVARSARVGEEQVVLQASLADECGEFRREKKTLRPGLKEHAFASHRADNAAWALLLFEEPDGQAQALETPRAGQAGDSSTDDDNRHGRARVRLRGHQRVFENSGRSASRCRSR